MDKPAPSCVRGGPKPTHFMLTRRWAEANLRRADAAEDIEWINSARRLLDLISLKEEFGFNATFIPLNP